MDKYVIIACYVAEEEGKRQPEGKSVMFFSNHLFVVRSYSFVINSHPLWKNKRLGGEPGVIEREL